MARATLAIAALTCACEPTVVIGSCSQSLSVGEAGATSAEPETVGVPWSTGFEDGMCGYHSEQGYCYARHDATLEFVSPRGRPGKYVAAFTVNGDAITVNGDATTADRSQARCVRQGVFPKSAYYGAWYLIPESRVSDGNWNLFHFLGRESETQSHALWDISLANDANGELELSVFNFLDGTHPPLSGVPPIPIGTWFQIEILLKRSAQRNGEVTVLQDGVIALHLTNLITDDTNWGQWYVGNYARKLVPALTTVYVDDVTIREGP